MITKRKYVHNSIDIVELNNNIAANPKKLVDESERNYREQLDHIADQVMENEDAKILLLAGPSASAKTTTSMKIMERLVSKGEKPIVISLDDFYLDRHNLPRLDDGSIDYETIETLDLKKLDQCLGELIKTGCSDFPVFDFSTGCRATRTNHIEMDKSSIIIMEGLHALNPRITSGYDSKNFVTMYISPHSDYLINGEIALKACDVRMVRRIIRDYFHRSSSLCNTLEMWQNVVLAEVDWIFPFRADADFVIDSTIIYEPCVYVGYLLPLIEKSDVSDDFKERINRIKLALERFVGIDPSLVPHDTVLREFLE